MKVPLALKKRVNSYWVGKLLTIAVVVSVAGASIVFWIVGKNVEASLVEQLFFRQQVFARAGANSIEDFLASVSSSVSSYAQMEKVIEGQEGAQDRLDLFVKRWLDTPVFSIALTDSEGIVVVSANRQGREMRGDTLADRDYFLWAKQAQAGQVFIGQAIYGRFGPVKDKLLIPVASTVFSEDEFKGVLISTVVLSELTKTYLDPLKIFPETRVYLIDSAGTMLHAPYEKFIGQNYFDYLASIEFKGKEKAVEGVEGLRKATTIAKEGKLDVIFPNEATGKLNRFLISHSPIKYQENTHWTLVMASTLSTALVFFPHFYAHQIGILVFVVFVVIALSSLAILAIRLSQREAFHDGFTRGRDYCLRWQKSKDKKK